MKLLSFATALLLLDGALAAGNPAINAFKKGQRKLPNRQRAPAPPPAQPKLARRDSPYLNEATEKFVVNGSAIPEVPFDIGESYAGLLPISGDPEETRKLYFWFFPSANPAASNEVLIWLNGGPGCSSLSGLLTENGPFTWESGTIAPVQNPYSWSNLTNVIWIEQPVGVGFSQGTPNITNEKELGLQFIGFYKQFVDAFKLHKRKVYITGESYAGYYVPYIADAFITANDKEYYNLAGVAINDPIFGDATAQQDVPAVPFADYWANLFNLNTSYIEELHRRHTACGYEEYYNKYLTFPPPQGPIPFLPDPYAQRNSTCRLLDYVIDAALEVNPCFNIYHVTETCPHPFNTLGIINDGDYFPPGAQVYFNRSDVQAAINAPAGTNWEQCTSKNVFNFGYINNYTIGDTSLGPAVDGTLQRVIEYTNNTIIGNGNLDILLSTNGTILALQNVTWNGLQGFQKYPGDKILYTPYHPEYNGGALAGAGELGTWGAERGVVFYTVQLAGHELPGYTPGAGYRVVEVLLGRVADLGVVSDFTTQTGNYTRGYR